MNLRERIVNGRNNFAFLLYSSGFPTVLVCYMHNRNHSAMMSPLSIVTALVDKIGKQDQLLCILIIFSNYEVLLGLGGKWFPLKGILMYI